jgi:biotin operon repressor
MDKELDVLAGLLRHRARTARQIAGLLGCSKPTVYARVRMLRARGLRVEELTNGAKRPGPAPAYFKIPRRGK